MRSHTRATRRSGSPLLLSALLATFGCGDASAGADDDGLDSLPRFELQEEVRVGSVDDAEVGFSDIARIAVDHEGLVYVLERSAAEVRVFSPDGERLRVIGGAGQGPGEFQFRLGGYLGLVGDTLWVSDPMMGRLTLFRRGGELLGTLTPRPILADVPEGFRVTIVPGGLRPDGYINTRPVVVVPPAARRPADVTLQIPTLRLDSTGALVDTIRLSPAPTRGAAQRVTVAGVELIVPLAPRGDPIWASGGDLDEVFVVEQPAAASADAGTLTVTRIAGRADTVWHRELRYQAEPPTAAFVDSLVATAVRAHVNDIRRERPDADSATSAGAAEAAVRGALELPPFAPAVSLAHVGEDQVLWLRRADRGDATYRWVLIGSDGEPLGQVDLPRSVTVHWSRGDTVWASRRDELQIPWLVRYRLSRVN